MMAVDLDLSADYIDVRDIIAHVEYLEGIVSPADETDGSDNEDRLELATLMEILDDLRGNGGDEQWKGDWYPVTLIRDSYFEEARDKLVEDIGALPKDIPSYLRIEVDYDAVRREYTSTEIEGVTYWYR